MLARVDCHIWFDWFSFVYRFKVRVSQVYGMCVSLFWILWSRKGYLKYILYKLLREIDAIKRLRPQAQVIIESSSTKRVSYVLL